jgi:hypothetical protein
MAVSRCRRQFSDRLVSDAARVLGLPRGIARLLLETPAR